jgi:hypothetical protein
MAAGASLLLWQANTSCHPHTALEDEIVVDTTPLVLRDVMDCKESTFGEHLMD